MNKCKVIVTGATGAIGTALLRYCTKEQMEAVAVIRPGTKRRNRIPNSKWIRVIECDLGDYKTLCEREEVQGCKYFFHLAWMGTFGSDRDNVALQEENVKFALEACEVANSLGCECFLFAGSQAEYGRVQGLLDGAVPTHPESEYGKAKLKAGLATRELCKLKDIRHVYVRILSVYGPGDGTNTMISSTIRKLQEGVKPQFTPAEQLWDYMYSDDAAEAMVKLAESGKDEKIYCIGSGIQRPLRDYIEIMGNLIAPEVPLGIGDLPYGVNQVMCLGANITDIIGDTGFQPKVSFEEGIRKMLEWERETIGGEKRET